MIPHCSRSKTVASSGLKENQTISLQREFPLSLRHCCMCASLAPQHAAYQAEQLSFTAEGRFLWCDRYKICKQLSLKSAMNFREYFTFGLNKSELFMSCSIIISAVLKTFVKLCPVKAEIPCHIILKTAIHIKNWKTTGSVCTEQQLGEHYAQLFSVSLCYTKTLKMKMKSK